MRGHIRKRGEQSYEYIVDIGTAAAQRCQDLQSPLLARAQAQGALSQVRRRADRDRGAQARHQGRLRHAARSAKPPSPRSSPLWKPRASRRPPRLRSSSSSFGVVAHRQRQPETDDLLLVRHARSGSTFCRASAPCSSRSSRPAAINALYVYLAKRAACTARVAFRPPRCAASTPCCTRPAATPCAGGAWRLTRSACADPPKANAGTARQAARLERRAAGRLPCCRRKRPPLRPLASAGRDRYAQGRGLGPCLGGPRHGRGICDHP